MHWLIVTLPVRRRGASSDMLIGVDVPVVHPRPEVAILEAGI